MQEVDLRNFFFHNQSTETHILHTVFINFSNLFTSYTFFINKSYKITFLKYFFPLNNNAQIHLQTIIDV